MNLRLVQFALLAATAGIASCAPTASPKLLGKWSTPTGGSIEFRADGTAMMAGPGGSRELEYRQPDAQTIELTQSGAHGAIRWKLVSVSEGELVVLDADGIETRLARAGQAGVTMQSAPSVPPAAPDSPASPY